MRLSKLIVLAVWLLVLSVPVHAQEDWKKIAPFGEPFTVSMPTAARTVVRMVPLTETARVPARVLYSLANGRRYAVVMFRRTTPVTDREVRNNPPLPPGAPDRNPPLTNFAEFVTAMEWSFTKAGEQPATLIQDKEFADEGAAVKQFELQIGTAKGVVRLLQADNSLYAQYVIGADKNDPDARRFLTSFQIGKPNDDDEPKVTNVDTSDGGSASQDLPPDPWPRGFSPISGGVLNGKALKLARPEYPSAARENYDQGQVRVQIVIDEFGRVITAEAISGPTTLREAAVKAALKSRFTPTRLMGQPVKISGVIVYNFVAQ